MKKLYTLMLAAASASMMFAQMPIMQQQLSLGQAPALKQIDKTEVVKLYNESKTLTRFTNQNNVLRRNAPSRVEAGKLTLNDLCKMDFIQSYTPYFTGQTDDEYWGDIYFTAGKSEKEVLMTGLFGFQDNLYGNIPIKGTFDEATQTISFPFEQQVYKSMQYNYYFSGIALVLNEEKTEIVDQFDYTAQDSFVLSLKDFDGQYAIRAEGAWDNSWDVIPLFGFYVTDAKGNGLGWAGLTVGEWFYMAQPNASITYKYVHFLDQTYENYEILDYDGNGFINYMQLEEGGDYAFQMGPFIQVGYGCPVMFVEDATGEISAMDTYMVGKKEYKNPAFIENDSYYYLNELTTAGRELGIYLIINADENGYFESCDFDCESWCAVDDEGYWFGECGPAHIELIEYESTGISTVAADKVQDGRWFNLQGIEVNKDKLQKGNIYINNGKKVLVK